MALLKIQIFQICDVTQIMLDFNMNSELHFERFGIFLTLQPKEE